MGVGFAVGVGIDVAVGVAVGMGVEVSVDVGSGVAVGGTRVGVAVGGCGVCVAVEGIGVGASTAGAAVGAPHPTTDNETNIAAITGRNDLVCFIFSSSMTSICARLVNSGVRSFQQRDF